MALTDVDVCNLAIGKCSGDRIDALGEESPLGAFCAETYPHTRETLLSAYRWAFCNTVRPLARLEIAADEQAVMTYKFAAPADLIGAVHDWRDHADRLQGCSVYVIQSNGAFWSDAAQVFGEYTAAKGEADWPVWFRNLVVHAYAVEVAHFCQLSTKANQLDQQAFGTPSENRRGGLFGAAMAEDARMAPQRTLVAGVEGGPLIEARFTGAGSLLGRVIT